MKILVSLPLATAIGVFCWLVGIPVPAPPAIVGALLVLSMTTGYVLADRLSQQRPKHNEALCGGPSGAPGAEEN